MKRRRKITLIVLGVIVVVLAIAIACADIIVSRIVLGKVNQALAELPGCEARCGKIQVRLFSGTAEVDSLCLLYHGEPVSKHDSVGPGIELLVERLEVGHVFYSMLLKKNLLVSNIRIVNPDVEVWWDDKDPKACFPKLRDPELEHADRWLEKAEINKFGINNARIRLHSLRTKLDVDVDSCSLTAHDLVYDSVFTYCDSLYDFSLAHADVLLPDGRMRIQSSGIEQSDQGELVLGPTRIAHTMSRKKLADLVKKPVLWFDLQIESLATSPFNPIRKAIAKDYTLDNIKIVIKKADLYRDKRYPPVKPYRMPQQALAAIPAKFRIGHADADIKQLDIAITRTASTCSELHIHNFHGTLDNITNRNNATTRFRCSMPVEKGKADADVSFTMNKNCDFKAKLHVANSDADFLNPFLRPLTGITCSAKVDTLDAQYTGDAVKATGTYRMLYHGLNIQVHKEDDVPLKIVTQHARTITTLANSLLTKSNPSSVDIHPREYKVEWKRDEWKPFSAYLFGPCIDGTKKTLLPGLNVHMQTRK